MISFHSNAKKPYYYLSNFTYIKDGIIVDDLNFPTTEHAYQAQKYIVKDRHRFTTTGDLGNIETGFQLVFGKKFEQKKKYWMKKNNFGIVAKTATNEKIGKKLGLTRIKDFVSTFEIWNKILIKKFTIPFFRNILLSTGDKYLLEFSRSARRETEQGKPPKWNGIIQDGKIFGENLMGIYLMKIRNIVVKKRFKEIKGKMNIIWLFLEK